MFSGRVISKTRKTEQEGTQSHTTRSKIMFSGHVISKTRTRQSRKEHNLIQQGVKSCSPDMLSQRHV